MQRYGGGMLYAALPLHMQRGRFRIRTYDQQVTEAQDSLKILLHITSCWRLGKLETDDWWLLD